jgi:hypothetical protein
MPLSKKSGKQFRRSLKTKDRKLADRRLKELKGQIGCLTLTDDAKLGFEAVANRWLPARLFNGKSASRISPRFSKAFRYETSPPSNANSGRSNAERNWQHKLSCMNWKRCGTYSAMH